MSDDYERQATTEKLDILIDKYGDDLLVMTGYDDCILGVMYGSGTDVVAYDYDKVIAKNMDMGMSEEEALEWFEYNQIGAYVGERTPVFIDTGSSAG